jgi:energy-converting hydrogenase Eha subunit A
MSNTPTPAPSGINFGPVVTAAVAVVAPWVATKLGVDSGSVAVVIGGVAALLSHFVEQLLTQPKAK